MAYSQERQSRLDRLFLKMIEFDAADPLRIQHFTKVHAYSRLIGIEEQIPEDTLYILEAAAYTHDIGIPVAEKKYGYQNGKLQEQEGPGAAQEMLDSLGFEPEVTERVCYLIGHHHTYTHMDGIDYQILVEADFLVNLFEDNEAYAGRAAAYRRIFRTQAGKNIMHLMFGDVYSEGQNE